jgi:succinate dehydrogenase / fumarate reductase cytochrome b subunit
MVREDYVRQIGQMNRARTFWRSTIGKKIVMAVTGLIMVGFLIGHVSGNLLVFRGPDPLNHYSAFLKGLGGLLWLARAILLASVTLHIAAAVQLAELSRAARPVDYQRRDPQVSTLAARTIRWSGALILLFVALHLLHFTTGTIQPVQFSTYDVYANVVGGFHIWWVSAFYIVSMVALGLHIYHGAWGSFRTLGASRPKPNPLHRSVATVVALFVWLGFTMIPVAVLLGVVR